MYSGIDVSFAQGNINWKKVKTDFVIIRDGYGKNSSQVDTKFERNYSECKKYGIPCGAYHYSYATSIEGAAKEADFCISLIKGKQFEYPIFFDIEDSSQAGLSKTTITDIINTFCARIKAAGYYPAVYASKYWLDSKIDSAKLEWDVWVAQWNSTCTYKGKYTMWQYSDKGSINGISGRVDLDYCYKDYPSLMKKEGRNGYTKTSPQKKKNVHEIAIEVLDGKWGNGLVRKQRLKAAGYDYDAVQKEVNSMLR